MTLQAQEHTDTSSDHNMVAGIAWNDKKKLNTWVAHSSKKMYDSFASQTLSV